MGQKNILILYNNKKLKLVNAKKGLIIINFKNKKEIFNNLYTQSKFKNLSNRFFVNSTTILSLDFYSMLDISRNTIHTCRIYLKLIENLLNYKFYIFPNYKSPIPNHLKDGFIV